MSKVKSLFFGDEGLHIVLHELANAEPESYSDGTLEVYGEDSQGQEGSSVVEVSRIAFEALEVITALQEKEKILDAIISERMAVTPEYEGGWRVEVYEDQEEPTAALEGLDLISTIRKSMPFCN